MPRISALFLTAAMVAAVACGDGSRRNVPVVSPSSQPAAAATATPDTAARSTLLARLPIAVFPGNFDYVPYDWSPDGTRIAFIGDERDVYIADGPAFTPHRLAGGPASEPRWSPDGRLIAFAHEDDGALSDIAPDDGIEIISADPGSGSPSLRMSPADDEWRGRIIQVYRWLDDHTIAYDAHCGSGCQLLFEMTVDRPGDGSAPRTPGVVRQVPFVRNCAGCMSGALAFHYSPDSSSVVAETGTMPALAWYERASETQWLLTFDGDPPNSDVFREFVSWDADSRSFVYRESIGTSPFADPPPLWTYWRADPATRSRAPMPTGNP
jgi:dipeptidyl aminopeptidase/acylaminoacyl peptidase